VGQERQVVQEGRHRRIEPVAVFQLQAQALFQVACENAGRIEPLQDFEHAVNTLVYDAVGERSAVVNPAGERLTYVYNSYGQVIARIHSTGRTGQAPQEIKAGMSGLLAARHFPGLVKAGDCVSVLAVLV